MPIVKWVDLVVSVFTTQQKKTKKQTNKTIKGHEEFFRGSGYIYNLDYVGTLCVYIVPNSYIKYVVVFAHKVFINEAFKKQQDQSTVSQAAKNFQAPKRVNHEFIV